jgi:hypothetical protein
MFEKEMTPEEVGRVTMMDLAIMVNEYDPPDHGSHRPSPQSLASMTPAQRLAWAKEYKQRLLADRDSWETD